MPIIDASVYVSLSNEADRYHQQSLDWFESALRDADRIAAPSLLLVEVGASIRRLTGSHQLARRVVRSLQDDELIDLLPLTSARTEAAASLAASTGVRGADAVYLALAKELDDVLVTLDRQQLDRGRHLVQVMKPC